MGVFRLMTYILEHREKCAEFVDLVEVAQQHGGIEILVDYYSFQQKILTKFWHGLSMCSGNPYLKVLGGEYGAFDAYLTKIVKDLKSVDINLVMFVDGSKGSSQIGTQQKLETWKQRHEKDIQKLHDLLNVIKGNKNVKDLGEETSVRPVLQEVQVFETLKECKCEVVHLSSGEADFAIAQNLQSRPKAYAVLSNDSDFSIFNNSKVIFFELFDIHNDLQLGSQTNWLPEKPGRLMCGVVSSLLVSNQLELASSGGLCELAIMAGNDFTSQYVRHIKRELGLKTIKDIARWVKQHERIEDNRLVAKEMKHNHHFRGAVYNSRKFYNMELQNQPSIKGFVSRLLDEGIQQGKFAANVMAMHNNFYWHRMLIEDNSYGAPCVEIALAPLRSYLYSIVLNRGENMVTEYGRTPWEQFSATAVYAADDRLVPTLNFVNQEKIFQNLKTFHKVMMHQEPYFSIYFFDRYGRRNGFISLILRYLLVLNRERNLHLDVNEFMAVAACVFCKVDEPWYCGLAVLPTVRAITILNWFQDIYRHAYEFLGKLLYLTHEFPKPKELVSGAVFAAFYTMLTQPNALRGLPVEWTQRIKHDINYIIGEKRHMIKNLLTEIFPFQDNFRVYLR